MSGRAWDKESVVLPRDPPPVIIRATALLVLTAAAAFVIGIFVVPLPRRAEVPFDVVQTGDSGQVAEARLAGVSASEVPEHASVKLHFEGTRAGQHTEATILSARDTAFGALVEVRLPSTTTETPGERRVSVAIHGTLSVELRREPLVASRTPGPPR